MQFRDQSPPSTDGPPRALRALGIVSMAAVLISTVTVDPKPGWTGDGPWVIAGIAGMATGLLLAVRRHEWFNGARFIGLALVGASAILFSAVQPDSAGYAGVYFVMAIGGIRLGRDAAIVVCGGTVVGIIVVGALAHENPGFIAGLLFSILPWFLVMRLIRRLGARRDEAVRLVEELRESREAEAEAAKLGERGRVARELHDVLAHSLSALSLQIEGTRLMATKSGADPSVIEGLERAHHLATSGLSEARQAISALRGDDLPAIEDLARGFPGARVTVSGTPREPSSEAKLALYRTAQEALTNVRRHSASERVELRLDYAADGTTLTVQDHGEQARAAERQRGLRPDRHARARRAARRPPDRRPDRRRLPGGAVAAGIRVLLADDQRVVREGLGTLLGLLDGIELVGTAADGEEAVALALQHRPDVVLMDLRMPRMDGTEAIKRLAQSGISAIALTTYADDASVLGALRAGARGYLTKDAGAEQIRAAVEAVARGEAALDPAIQHHVLAAVSAPVAGGGPGRPHPARGRGVDADRRRA